MSLPPLHLLKTFEVAARELSFKRAANDLNITPSAVSHQMRQLEEHLDITLFARVNRGLRLTSAGQAFFDDVQPAIDSLTRACRDLNKRFGSPQLRASVLPLMAAEIIIPALGAFHDAHPEVSLRLETSLQPEDFELSELDVAIRYGMGDWPGLVSERISDIAGSPMCSPAYAKEKQLKEVADIARCNLIGLPMVPRAWNLLADQAGIEPIEMAHSLSMDSLLGALRAAEQGLGMGIGVFPLMNPLVESGRIVRPFNVEVRVPEGYYLVWRPEDEGRADLQVFRQWVKTLFAGL